jgi:hypothetical protein
MCGRYGRRGDKQAIAEAFYVASSLEGGIEVNLHVPGTNLERFRVRVSDLTFVEREAPARTSNPFTTPESTLDTTKVLEKIANWRNNGPEMLDPPC